MLPGGIRNTRSRYPPSSPDTQVGVTDHVWTISELVEAVLHGVVTGEPQGRKVGRFTVFDGGR